MDTKKKTPYKNGKTVLEELLNLETWDEDLKGNRKKMTIAELMHVKMVKKALEGDLKAYAEVLDRVEGKAVQKIEEKTEHTFVSKPLSELVQFVTPTKTLDEKTNEIIEMVTLPDGAYGIPTEPEPDKKEDFFSFDTSSDVEEGENDTD